MKGVELYGRVRYAVQIEGLNERAAARRFGLDLRTVAKMVRFSVPPGYVRKTPPSPAVRHHRNTQPCSAGTEKLNLSINGILVLQNL